MTVKQLIEELQKMPPNARIIISITPPEPNRVILTDNGIVVITI